jgi:hypothetical protein
VVAVVEVATVAVVVDVVAAVEDVAAAVAGPALTTPQLVIAVGKDLLIPQARSMTKKKRGR